MKEMIQINLIYSNIGKTVESIALSIFTLLLFISMFTTTALAQNSQSLELAPQSVPDDNAGPSVIMENILLFHNYNNPSDEVFTPYYPETDITIEFDNFRYFIGDGVLQNTNQDDDNNENPPVVFGWLVNPDDLTAEGNVEGVANPEGIIVPFTDLDESINSDNIYSIGAMEGFYSSIESEVGSGIDFSANHGFFIAASFEGLGPRDLNQPYAFIDEEEGSPTEGNLIGGRYPIADMTITFNRPVTNPILHFFGLGGFWDYFTPDFDSYLNAATVEFDLIDPEDHYDLVLLSTSDNDGLGVDGKSIVNNFNIPDILETEDTELDDNGVANGSVMVRGQGITSITFVLHARAIRNVTVAQDILNFEPENCDPFCDYFGDPDFGWGGDATTQYGDVIDPYNIAHDLFVLSVSTDVDPDTLTFAHGDSFRMISSPLTQYEFDNGETDPTSQRPFTYNELIGQLWTQGGPEANGYNTEFGDPNIFTWDLGRSFDDTTDLEEDDFGWNSILNLDEDEIPVGHGFLMTVFEFDDYETETGTFPKEFIFTGSEWGPTPIVIESDNGVGDGWMLLGNPFKDPISIERLLDNAQGTNWSSMAPVIYVWDRGDETRGEEDPPIGFIEASFNGSLTSDFDEDVLMPFQGFLIQKSDDPGSVSFDDNLREPGAEGTFYRKERDTNNKIRLIVEGDNSKNSLWLTFSNNGSEERLISDALKLMPWSEDYTLLSTKKEDNVLLSISHLPYPDEEFEIPVNVQTTMPGLFTISATDFNLSLAQDLYLVDLHEDISVRIDENLSYTFEINQAAKANPKPVTGMINGPKKATAEYADRFLITTQPRELDSTIPDAVALNQNYPNPFNPTTQITYELPQQTDVRLTVYDMVGRQVATLVNETVQAGVHNVNFDASSLSSGVYIYRLQTGSTTLSRKLTVIK